MKKKHNFITISLLVLLATRATIGLVAGITLMTQSSSDTSFLSIGILVFSVVNLVAFMGIFTKQYWGAVLALLAAVADLMYYVLEGGNLLSGSTFGGALIVILAYKAYQKLK